jgi:hypothetical protein
MKPIMILESKGLDTPLVRAETQVKEYSKQFPNCNKLVVSNGIKYKLFTKGADGEWKPIAFLNLLNPLKTHPYEHNVKGAPELLAELLP